MEQFANSKSIYLQSRVDRYPISSIIYELVTSNDESQFNDNEEQESKSVSNIGSVAIDLLESDNDSENDRAFGNGNNQLSTTDNDSTSSNTKTPVPKFVTIGRGSDAFVGKKQGKKVTKRKQLYQPSTFLDWKSHGDCSLEFNDSKNQTT